MITSFVSNDFSISDENHLIENTQIFILFLAFIFSIRTTFNRFRKDKIIPIFFAFLSVGSILREIDIENSGLPFWLVAMGSGTGRTILLITGFLIIFSYVISKFRYYSDLGQVFLKSKAGWSLLLSGIFLVVGSLFEDIDIASHVLIEECLELIAYGWFFRAVAIISRRELKTSKFI